MRMKKRTLGEFFAFLLPLVGLCEMLVDGELDFIVTTYVAVREHSFW